MSRTLICGRFRLRLGGRPLVMGVLNVTPDSFSDGGRWAEPEAAIRQAERMVEERADLIDVGGESTRPGASPVPVDEELQRVLPVVRVLGRRLPVPISIDTAKADVAEAAIAAGAALVNDVTALRGDARMPDVVGRAGVPVILMHRRGTPRTMQQRPRYHDVVSEVRAFLAEAIQRAVQAGLPHERLLIDPGLGFGKTVRHNLLLLQGLEALQALGCPIVVGPSRKSFIGQTLNADVTDRLAGTLACVAEAARHRAAIIRVHDVKPTVQFLTMWEAIGDATGREHRSRRDRPASPARVGA